MASRGMSSTSGDSSVAIARELKTRLRQAVGDVRGILSLIREAERLLQGKDLRALADLIAVGMHAFGPCPLQTAANDYGELCVKRLQVLCKIEPDEARTFNSFLAHYEIRQQDPRLLQAMDDLGHTTTLSELGEISGKRRSGVQPMRGCRGSNTPIRPRALRYSGCGDTQDTSELEEVIAAAAASLNSSGDEESPPPRSQQAGPSFVPCKAAAVLEDMAATMELTRVSILDNLSPIPEAESLEEPPPPPTAAQGISSMAQSAAESVPHDAPVAMDCSEPAPEATGEDGKPLKTIIVNGVQYTRLQTIGRGGSSKVYQVRAPCGTLLALKRVTATCAKHFEALSNEVTLLQQLKDCPNVIQVYDAEVLPEKFLIHIVMEQGDADLGRLLQDQAEDLNLGDLQALWRQMLEAVQVIHTERIVHSDLKPGNFLMVGKRLKIIDFGIAKKISANTTNISRETSVGTISYMAPEAVRQGALKIGRPSDIWSLGIILYQMVYMKSPFAHLDPMQRLFALTDPNMCVEFPSGHRLEGHSTETKDALMDVLNRCLQRDQRKRPSIPELLEHRFLRSDTVRLNRGAFNRTMEALVTGFYSMAEAALNGSDNMDESGISEGDEGQGIQECWQILSDQVWEHMAKNQDGPQQGIQLDQAVFSGLVHFKEWLGRGSAKRQKLSPPVRTTEESARPPAPAQSKVNSEPAASAAAAQVASVARLAPKSTPATQSPAAIKPAVFPKASNLPVAGTNASKLHHQPAALPREPFKTIGGYNSNSSMAAPAKPTIDKDDLLIRKHGLRKVNATPAVGGKENEILNAGGGDKGSTAAKGGLVAPDNLVLKRLKERRAVAVDAMIDEEQTQLTQWGPN
eukprot:TRINITY_DN16792_c0_g1_i1.p1 TRINITY_DN16792_c0_g1~~TRINITY_DN16792_c0_g1_i1.p1  ORF type:complete len:880 (+),score=208.26 TRINITY_DN16792_c0_g1_i1:67-2640(+)